MTDNLSCPICKLESPEFQITDGTGDYGEEIICNCARCGKFLISKTTAAEINKKGIDVRTKVSSWLRMQNEFQKPMPKIKINDGTLAEILKNLPSYTPFQKQSILLNALANKSEYPGKPILFIPRFDYPLAWAINEDELVFHTKSLLERNLIDSTENNELNKYTLTTDIIVTVHGWDYFQKHLSKQVSSGNIPWEPNFQHGSLDAETQESHWDVFISHASEDKKDVVEPLAKELRSRNLKVWYDKWVLKIGDRLLEKIDHGLLQSRYGIVVLSPNFLRKDWPKNELDGLIQKEVGGRKVILPIWHNLRRSEIISYSPILAGRLAGSTETGIKALAEELIEAMEDLPIQTEEVVISKSFDINASFKNVRITGDLHRYSFIFGITLNTPPAKKNFLVRLYWPAFIRVTMNRDFTNSRTVIRDGNDFTEYSYQSEQRLYPGDTFEVVSPKGRTELEYEFDHNIWSKVEHGKHEILWEIYFEDQLPVKGSINFKQLNIF
ncbi:MAG: hypothetical protein A3G93_16175 [Nitrospinae bacterium RIFCSPLOWO2_12_FULL_45_22]|nr:MAG: hypothetical protein A3G93_16175 [Nitrospinae bacterium RIFCSPLOWO2_12_FULL_45_22]